MKYFHTKSRGKGVVPAGVRVRGVALLCPALRVPVVLAYHLACLPCLTMADQVIIIVM